MMKAYEFSTKVTADGKLALPAAYAKDISTGNSVRVIVLVNEEILSTDNQQEDVIFSLEEVIKKIKSSLQNLANVQPASGLLAEHLANSPEIPDPSFDVTEWNREWDKIEAEMKIVS